MARKTGLGKGLDALIPSTSNIPAGGVEYALVDAILPNPKQPRTRFDEGELQELAGSIREHGVIQPLIVARGANSDEYVLIAGERRLQAARRARLTRVPVIVREASDQQLLEIALIENVQRADLSPLEAAEAFKRLGDEFGLKHEEIAARVGKSRVAITNTLSLLELSAAVKQALADGKITEGHARALKGLSAQSQGAALQSVIKRGLNVRQTEELARKLKGTKPTIKIKRPLPPEIRELQERLREALSTRVSLTHGAKGGTIVLHYYSDEELDALVERLLGESK